MHFVEAEFVHTFRSISQWNCRWNIEEKWTKENHISPVRARYESEMAFSMHRKRPLNPIALTRCRNFKFCFYLGLSVRRHVAIDCLDKFGECECVCVLSLCMCPITQINRLLCAVIKINIIPNASVCAFAIRDDRMIACESFSSTMHRTMWVISDLIEETNRRKYKQSEKGIKLRTLKLLMIERYGKIWSSILQVNQVPLRRQRATIVYRLGYGTS